MVNPHQVARDTAEVGLTRLIRALAVITPSLALVQTLANLGNYRHPAAAIAVWVAVLGAGAWLAPRAHTGRLTVAETTAAIAIAVGAVAAIGAVHRVPGDPRSVNLAILGTVWLLLLIAASHSARVWIPVALLVFVLQGALLIRELGLNRLSLSQVGAAGYIIATLLTAFAALRSALNMRVGMAARQASLASRSAAERAAAAAVKQERDSRLAVMEREALPLLRGIADGTLDPADPGVREQCGRHAAVLRQALAGSAPGSELVAGLAQTLRTAAARGVAVTVQLIGDRETPRPPVARAVLATVDAVLGALSPQQAVLTVLATGEGTELYLTFGEPLRAPPDLAPFGLGVPAAACWHARVNTGETGGGYLEVSWRKDGAA